MVTDTNFYRKLFLVFHNISQMIMGSNVVVLQCTLFSFQFRNFDTITEKPNGQFLFFFYSNFSEKYVEKY